MLIAVMAAGLFMNASITRAFDDTAWVFVAAFLGIQLGRTAWMLTTHLDQINHDHFVRTLVWLGGTAPLWIVGAAVSAEVRLVVWGVAAAVDVVGVWFAHPLFSRRLHSGQLQFGGEHMMERFRLFLLIALGETIVTPGVALADAPIRVSSIAGGLLALVSTLCLWGLYFRGEPIALRHVASTEDRVYASRMGANGLLLMIAGLIVLAAGNALVIAHPSREATLAIALMLSGGPALFLVARAGYMRLVFGTTSRAQLVAIALLAATAASVWTAPALVAALVVVAVLVGLVSVERLRGIG